MRNAHDEPGMDVGDLEYSVGPTGASDGVAVSAWIYDGLSAFIGYILPNDTV